MKTNSITRVLISSMALISSGFAQDSEPTPANDPVQLPPHFDTTWKDLIKPTTDQISNFKMIQKYQDAIINKKHPEYRRILSINILDPNNSYIEVVGIINNENKIICLNFDMTDIYKFLKTKDEETKKLVEEEERHYIKFVK